jgi:hypothetical protein
MNSLAKKLDDEETTRQFAGIMRQYSDPIEIKRKQLLKKRIEILKDKNYGIK